MSTFEIGVAVAFAGFVFWAIYEQKKETEYLRHKLGELTGIVRGNHDLIHEVFNGQKNVNESNMKTFNRICDAISKMQVAKGLESTDTPVKTPGNLM